MRASSLLSGADLMDSRSGAAKTLEVLDVCKEFASPVGPLVVLRDISFSLSPGESVAIVGPSGAGKSTLLNIIGSLEAPTSGSVALGSTVVTALRGRELAAYRSGSVGFVFQDHHLLPQCTALENAMLPTLASPSRGNGSERAALLLESVGLAERMHYFPAQLSGGEKQRVAIARALVNSPSLLLCDEPTGNLDAATGDSVADIFLKLADEQGVMLLVVTHNHSLAGRMARCYELREGCLKPKDVTRAL